jgi:hypothetical protein
MSIVIEKKIEKRHISFIDRCIRSLKMSKIIEEENDDLAKAPFRVKDRSGKPGP